MTRNVTLTMDEKLLTKLGHMAAAEHMSLSAWIVSVLEQRVADRDTREATRRRALDRLGSGFRLGGTPLPREDTHAR